MADGPTLTEKERRDVFALGALLVLGLTVVLVVLVVQNDWDERRWAALGAIASAVQSVGVIAALLYARREIATGRELAERRRRQETIDRVASIAYEIVAPAVSDFLTRVTLLSYAHDQLSAAEASADSPAASEGMSLYYLDRFRESRQDTDAAVRALDQGAEALHRALIAAGHEDLAWSAEMTTLRVTPLLIHSGALDVGETTEQANRVRDAWNQLEGIVTKLVASVAR